MFTPSGQLSRRASHTISILCCIRTHLPAGSIHGLLGGGIGVDGGHEPLNNAILVVDHLCQRSKAVGGTGGVAREKGDNHMWKGWYKCIDNMQWLFTATLRCKKTHYIQRKFYLTYGQGCTQTALRTAWILGFLRTVCTEDVHTWATCLTTC